ncbi:MAG: tRNA uridine-5-carboxymethylaminomethyl(34) synthesis enzyme MnmG [Sedimentisphaerales bacterium]|jgi:tRNA uridine 5-carboxymethylaminomethyl modification enzyme|nr:tRNA uridine-5-carboxymethylaminomethyl(34) synthesis enzyme MnmG [Sedimentisphaerales bacterium]
MGSNEYDCIVIGAGHAGVEAAHAAAKMGAKTCLITIDRQAIARMSCNPAVGGIGKGQIVREVDALGGLMGLATDATGIQFRMLNRSKGPAVQSPRAQTDKYEYSCWIQQALMAIPNLTILEAMVEQIIVEGRRVRAVVCQDGTFIKASAIVLAPGTFLRGLIHIGDLQYPGGRRDEPCAQRLSESLASIGLQLGRLKTGTPPRLDASTVDLDQLEVQQGDPEPEPFSFMNDRISVLQIPCWITWTNPQIHQLLLDNLNRAPLYTGQIKSTGPRYCPSIETKVVRFADKTSHQVFLEPEERAIKTIYCNGISTSLPKDVQERMIQLLPGTQRARIIHYGYAIEYDYCPPTQLTPGLQTRQIEGLFLAGQINGTSGYEEAAGQGIIAGINAVLWLRGKEPLVLGRDQAYIGVMIDDLMTKEITEPYRVFTSRAEHRLSLRADNADRRLTPIGREIGLVDDQRWRRYQQRLKQIGRLTAYLKATRIDGISIWQHLARPQSDITDRIRNDLFISSFPRHVVHTVLTDARYEGYLAKQGRLTARLQSLEHAPIPADIDYQAVPHLRSEAREKLTKFRPMTLGQASRIDGVTPADLVVLQIYLKARHPGQRKAE